MDEYCATYSELYPYSGPDTAKKPYSDNPCWRYALRCDDGRQDAFGAPPHWRCAPSRRAPRRRGGAAPLALRPPSRRAPRRRGGVASLAIRPPQRRQAPRRREGAAPLAIRPPSRRAPRRRDGAAPQAIRPQLPPYRATTPRRRPTGVTPSVRTRGCRPTGDTPSAETTGGTTPFGRRPTGDTPCCAPVARPARGVAPRVLCPQSRRPPRRRGALPHWRHALAFLSRVDPGESPL